MRVEPRATLPAAVTSGRGVTGYAALTACAWLALVAVQRSEYAWFFSHDVLGARGVAVPLAVVGFTAGWTLMTVAMMTPGALSALARLRKASAEPAPVRHGGTWRGAAWLAGNLAPWLLLGFVFAAFDLVVHAAIEPALPLFVAHGPALLWLAAGAQILAGWRGATLVGAPSRNGMPGHRGALAHNGSPPRDGALAGHDHWSTTFLAGWRAGLRCLRGGWLLMLAVAGSGHASLPTMAATTLLMAAPSYEWVPRWAYGVAGCIVAFTAAVAAWPG